MVEIRNYIAGFMVYFLIGIGALGMIYGEGWNILYYTIIFLFALRILIMKTKQEIYSNK